MSQLSLPNPEFHVECAMCDQSFSATADTLEELVEIVALHLRQVKDQGEKPHDGYLQKHKGEEYRASTILKHYEDGPSAILDSPGFRWDIQRLVPYNKVFDIVGTPLRPFGRAQTLEEKAAIVETAHTKES